MKLIFLLSSIVNALSLDQAVNQISASVQKVLPLSAGIKFSSIVPTTILDHYHTFQDIRNPTKRDLITAVKDTTIDLQLKSIRILHNSLAKRDLNTGDIIAQLFRDRKDFLLDNDDNYQRLNKEELELQNHALDQQAADFQIFFNSLADMSDEDSGADDLSVPDEPRQKLIMDTIDVQLEKDAVESDMLDNDKELNKLHQELVDVDPGHKFLQVEKNNQLETLKRQFASARVILENVYQRIGIKEKTWKNLQSLSDRMERLATSNPTYSHEELSPVAAELDKILKSSPNLRTLPILITMSVLIGAAAPPVLFAMFSSSETGYSVSESFDA